MEGAPSILPSPSPMCPSHSHTPELTAQTTNRHKIRPFTKSCTASTLTICARSDKRLSLKCTQSQAPNQPHESLMPLCGVHVRIEMARKHVADVVQEANLRRADRRRAKRPTCIRRSPTAVRLESVIAPHAIQLSISSGSPSMN